MSRRKLAAAGAIAEGEKEEEKFVWNLRRMTMRRRIFHHSAEVSPTCCRSK
jgi:hypothetical protein